MRDDVVARAFEVVVDAAVEALARRFVHLAGREQLHERSHGALDEEQRERKIVSRKPRSLEFHSGELHSAAR